MNKYALITGITGQDGSYLSEFLLEKGYSVYGILRKASQFNTQNVEHIRDKLHLSYGDVTDGSCLLKVLDDIAKTDYYFVEVYNLAAMSHVKVSFELPIHTLDVDAGGTVKLLNAIVQSNIPIRKIRFYQASTGELYGKVVESPQSETTPFYPRSPYAAAKLYSY